MMELSFLLNRLRFLLVSMLLLALPASAQAVWPAKPIHWVVPFAAGGPADSLARMLGAKMAQDLGQQIIIDNRAGAGGTLGAAEVARAKPDGYTWLFSSTGALVIFPAISSNLPYDPERDLIAVGQAVVTPMVIVTAAQSRFNSLDDLIREARARPGQLNFASAGSGTTTQLGIEMLKRDAGIAMTHIPYRGAAPAITDLIAGSPELMLADLPAVMSFIKAGRLKPLAITWPKRSPILPNLPTTAEYGLKEVVSSTWYGLLAPAKTPPDLLMRLNAAMNKALQHAEIQAYLQAQGVEAVGGSAAEFASFIRLEAIRLGGIAKAVGASVD